MLPSPAVTSGAFLVALALGSLPEPLFRPYSAADGLPSSEVYQVTQDHDGYIWLATDRGTARFNGTSFEMFSTADGLPDNSVLKLQLDATGRLWFFTWTDRLAWRDGDGFHVLDAIDEHVPTDSHAVLMSALLAHDGTVHVGLREHGHLVVSPNGRVGRRPPVGDGTGVVFQEIDGSLLRYQQDKPMTDPVKAWLVAGRQAVLLDDSFVHWDPQLLRRSDGSLVVTDTRKVMHFDASGTPLPVRDPPTFEWVVGLAERASGLLVVAERNGRTHVLDRDLAHVSTSHAHEGTELTDVFRDREGGLWLPHRKGVFHRPGTDAVTYQFSKAEGGPAVAALAEHPERGVVAATHGGRLHHLAGPHAKSVELPGLPVEAPLRIYVLAPDEGGGYWIGASPSSAHWHDGTLQPDVGGYVFDILPTGPGEAMFAGLLGITRNGSPERLEGSRDVKNFALHRGPNGRTWVGTSKGLRLWDGESVRSWGTDPRLRLRVEAITETTDGRLIVGTLGEGLLVVEGDQVVRVVGVAEGLASNMVHALHLEKDVEKDVALWVGTTRGVSRVALPLSPGRRPVTWTITRSEGLVSDEVNDLTVRSGTLWVATPLGVTALSTEQRVPPGADVPVHVRRVLVEGELVPRGEPIVLTPRQDDLTVEFEGLAISRGRIDFYSYRVDGVDDPDAWRRTTHPAVQFTTLTPGAYALQVTATTTDGRTTRQPARLEFTKRHALWQEPSFQAACAVVVIGLAIAGVRARLGTVRRRAAEDARVQRQLAELQLKALRAQINPHFMFNTMASIQHYLTEHDAETASDYLAKFAQLVRRVLDQSDRQYVTVADEVETLELYLELEEGRSRGSFTHSLHVDPAIDLEVDRIPSMIIQPHVENAIWHGLMPGSEVGHLDVRLEAADDGILCTIRDDGAGLDTRPSGENGERSGPRGTGLTADRLALLGLSTGLRPRIEARATRDDEGAVSGTIVEILLPLDGTDRETESE